MNIIEQISKERELILRDANESIYIISEYGVEAWFELSGWSNKNEAVSSLNNILKILISEERYESCKLIQDTIKSIT